MRSMRILAAAMSAMFGSAWFLFAVPTIAAAVNAAPMITATKTGFLDWAAWMRDYIATSVITLQGFLSMDWLSAGALAGIGLFALIAGLILFSALRPRPPQNDIIDAQPPAADSNEYGNTRWMRKEKEICRELGLVTVEIDKLGQEGQKSGLYCGEFGNKVLLAADDEHMLILAPTRVGKTRRVLLKQLAVLIKSGESFCAFDPKGELFGLTSELAEECGTAVNRLDLRSPELGNYINVLGPAIHCYMGGDDDGNGRKTAPINKMLETLDKKKTELARILDKEGSGGISAKERNRRAELEADIEDMDAKITDRLEEAEHEISQVTSFVFPREIEKEGNSKFFNDGAENLIQMTLHYLCSSLACPEHDKGLFTASNLISKLCNPEKLTSAPGEDRLFSPLIEEVHTLNQRHPAYRYMTKIDNSRNLGDFVTTATGAMARYTASSIARMMTSTDIPFAELADRPTATYIIVPNDDTTYNSIAMLFVAQMYTALMRHADELGGRLPVRMNMVCEELKQLPVIDGLDQKLSICAGFGVRWILVLQSLTQLESAYGREDAATIMENCRIQMCLQAGTPQTGEYIEKRCGDYTINMRSTSSSKVPAGLMADRNTSSQSLGKRARCSSSEAQRWNPDQGTILMKIGCKPACSPIPELSVTPFNAMLGMGSPAHNTEKQHRARAKAVHSERVALPTWSIELDSAEEAARDHTDAERKKLERDYLKKLKRNSKERQGAAPKEGAKGAGKETGGKGGASAGSPQGAGGKKGGKPSKPAAGKQPAQGAGDAGGGAAFPSSVC